MTNYSIAKLFDETAELLHLAGENPFKIKAYEKGADAVRGSDEDIAELIKNGSGIQINGIGKGILEHIRQVIASGTFPELEQLRLMVPYGVREIAKLPGIGPKKVTQIWKEIGITSLDELADACSSNRLSSHKGFTSKTENEILHHIHQFNKNKTRLHLFKGEILASQIEETVFIPSGITDFFRTGEIRRCLPVITQLEWLIISDEKSFLNKIEGKIDNLTHFSNTYADKHHISAFTFKIENRITGKIYLSESERKFFHLYALTEYDLGRDVPEDVPKSVCSEQEIFRYLNIAYLPPEIREEGTAFLNKYNSADNLLKINDLKGTLHAHSTWSDGGADLQQMAAACMERGFSYLGITDHSRSAAYASGLQPERVKKQWAEIDELNRALAPFRVFKGIESDILKDGSLDYEPEILAGFDFIIASIHSQMNMNEGEATYRLIQAVKNPYTTILGHMTGRLLLRREGYPVNELAVINACAENGVAIEINGNPYRMDMDWSLIRYATEKGVKIAVTSDAHSKSDLDYHLTAVKVARKGWLHPEDTLNCMNATELEQWFLNKKRRI